MELIGEAEISTMYVDHPCRIIFFTEWKSINVVYDPGNCADGAGHCVGSGFTVGFFKEPSKMISLKRSWEIRTVAFVQ